MSKAKSVEHGWVVKHPATGKYVNDDRELVASISEAEQFFHKQDAANYRDAVAYHTAHKGLEPVKVRVTTEEV